MFGKRKKPPVASAHALDEAFAAAGAACKVLEDHIRDLSQGRPVKADAIMPAIKSGCETIQGLKIQSLAVANTTAAAIALFDALLTRIKELSGGISHG
jgi:hypothetical protein